MCVTDRHDMTLTIKVALCGGMQQFCDSSSLDRSKLKAFADNKINVTETQKFVLGRVENSMGKGENAGYQHFLIFPLCFQKAPLSGSFKAVIVW